MLEAYRALAAERPGDWGGELDGFVRAQPYGRWLGGRLLAAAFSGQLDDWPATVRACLTDPLPAGLVVASLDAAGIGLRAGPVPYVLEGGAVEVAVLLDSHLEEATRVEVGGTPVRVGAGGGAAPAIDTEVRVDGPIWLCAVAAAPAIPRCWGRWCSPTPAPSGSRSTAGRSAARPAPAGCWTGWTASRPCSASMAASPTTPSGPRSWPWSSAPAAGTGRSPATRAEPPAAIC